MAFHIKIGNYRFSKNLGTGSFGKVKSNVIPINFYSGIKRSDWAQSCYKNFEQEEDKVTGSL